MLTLLRYLLYAILGTFLAFLEVPLMAIFWILVLVVLIGLVTAFDVEH
jgi:hypothetical protein